MTRTCHGTVITVHTGAVTSASLLTAPVPPAPMLASTGRCPPTRSRQATALHAARNGQR